MLDIDRAALFIFESNAIEGIRKHTYDQIHAAITDRQPHGHVGAFLHLHSVAEMGRVPLKADLLYAHDMLLREQIALADDVAEEESRLRGQVGRWRTCGVSVGGRDCPHSAVVPALMSDLLARGKAVYVHGIEPKYVLEEVADDHYAFLRAHPFIDGNGRISRLYANAIIARYEMPLLIFTSADKQVRYYAACAAQTSLPMRLYFKENAVRYAP